MYQFRKLFYPAHIRSSFFFDEQFCTCLIFQEEMCLLCKKLGLAPGGPEDEDGVPGFLGKAMSAPHPKSISNALELLVDLGAMQPETNNLTDLGECLAMLSLEPR